MLRKRLLLVTGSPGIGKTTVLVRVVEALKSKGYGVGGMISREVRSGGNRVGFEILDLKSGKRGWLASVGRQWGAQVGRYRVNLSDLNDVGVKAVVEADHSLDAVIVDEIGPMELLSNKFREAVAKVAEGRKLAICTIHWKMRSSLIEEVKKREDAEIFVVTYENRENLPQTMVAKAVDFLSGTNAQ